jgi:NAD(P)H dehydrogenase (quinone)
MLIVTGANGKLGRLVVEALLERVDGSRIAVSVRDPEGASAFAHRGVRVRHGDYADPTSLASAFEGGSRVLIVSSNTAGAEAVRHHQSAIDAARAAGARRIFYTSHVGASSTSAFAPMVDHAATEVALERSGVPFTVLPNGFYVDSALMILGRALESGELAVPADGPVSWTAHADLAQATAALLREEADDGEPRTVSLTAAEALDFEGIAAAASRVTGRAIRRVVVDGDSYLASMVSRGVPAPRAAFMLGMFSAAQRGDFAKVDPALATILNRAPLTVADALTALIARTRASVSPTP